jgi:ABC-type dipeptide/oligopeptide/nickel transport system permease component
VRSGILRYIARRVLTAALLVLVVSSASFLLARLAPGDHLSGFDVDPAYAASERRRLGFDRPILEQYGSWLSGGARLDFGESLRFRRPVTALVRERAGNTALLGTCALLLATVVGIPLGVLSGSRRGYFSSILGGTSLLLLSIPPLVTSLLLLVADLRWGPDLPRVVLPALALALPITALLERLQAQAMGEALAEPSIAAAVARGIPARRVVWRHGLRLSLKPVLAIYGIVIGGVLSGSFVVEIVLDWPGLGDLMYEALIARDLYLVAGCAAAVSGFLAAGILAADLAVIAVDPRIEAPA